MTPIEVKLLDAWEEFKSYAGATMGYTNKTNLNECLLQGRPVGGAIMNSVWGRCKP
jgi:hypothetical protein